MHLFGERRICIKKSLDIPHQLRLAILVSDVDV
jgi:hypothetical protein